MNGGALVPLDRGTHFSLARPIHKLKLLLQVSRSMLSKIQSICPSLEILWQISLHASLSPPVPTTPTFLCILFPLSLIWVAADLALALAKEVVIQ